MSFRLDNVVPWGRSRKEYIRMFQLDGKCLSKKILDCGGGPSSFNAEITRRGGSIVSCDPLYRCNRGEIEMRIKETYDDVLKETIRNQEKFIWKTIKNTGELGKIRMAAMNQFLADFEKGKTEGRYIPENLPQLSFSDKEFDLALSSHFLFLYTGILSLEFHKQAVLEMCRVAKEVRIFPLLDLNNHRSSYIPHIRKFLDDMFNCEIIKVEYEFQKGADEMLRIISRV